MTLQYDALIDFSAVASLGKELALEAARLHREAMLDAAKAQEGRRDGQGISASALFSSAFEKEREVAEMIEPGMQAEPMRTLVHHSAATLALNSQDIESARNLVAKAMLGIPGREHIEDLRGLLAVSFKSEETPSEADRIGEGKAGYAKALSSITTNLSRRHRFLDQLLALMPEVESLDIVASDFELASFLLLSGQWQFADRVRMVVGRPAASGAGKGEGLADRHDMAIEREKTRTDDLSGLFAVKAALSANRLQIGVHTKDDMHGAAYIIKTRDGAFHGFVGSAGFTENGLIHPLQLMASLPDSHSTELVRLFDSLHASSQNINEQLTGLMDRCMNPDTERRILENKPEEKGLRGRMWFWNFLPPAELNDLLSLYHRVSHKVLRISETTGLEGEKLLTPDDHFKTLKDFNAVYEGKATTEEQLRLLLNKALQDDPDLERFLQDLPWRVFSARPAAGGVRGVFACYRFPPGGAQSKSQELGELRWYFLPDGSDKVLTTLDEINRHIASEPATPRPFPGP